MKGKLLNLKLSLETVVMYVFLSLLLSLDGMAFDLFLRFGHVIR